MKPSTHFNCDLLYYRGIHYCKKEGELYHLYYKWTNCISPYSSLLEFFKAHNNCLRSFMNRAFGGELQIRPIRDMHLRFINQISGIFFEQWASELSFVERDGQRYHQCNLKPDIWYSKTLNPTQEKSWTGVLTPRTVYVQGTTSSSGASTRKSYGTHNKLRQFQTRTLAIYAERSLSLGDLDTRPLVWVPIYPSEEGRQEFALIFQHQKDIYDADLMSKPPGTWWVHPDDFRKHMSKCVDECSAGVFKNYFKAYPGMRWQGEQFDNIVISIISHEQAMKEKLNNPTFIDISHGQNMQWAISVEYNFTDVDNPVKSIVALRVYPWPFERFLRTPHHELLLQTYFGSGQNRNVTNHRGNNRMLLFRQTSQASSSMGAVSSTSEHHFWNEGNTNTSTVQSTTEMSHALSEEATQAQDCSGQNMISLVKQAIKEKYGWSIESHEVCPYMILTMPKFNKKTRVFESFSNTKHNDRDETDDETGQIVDDHVIRVNCASLNDYIAEMKHLFPEYEKKKRYPLPTTCCWSLHDPNNFSRLFSHKQHFILTEAGVATNPSYCCRE